MNERIDECHDCFILHKQTHLTGYWYIHKNMTGPKPKIDFLQIKDFGCDQMANCQYDASNCPVKKAMEHIDDNI